MTNQPRVAVLINGCATSDQDRDNIILFMAIAYRRDINFYWLTNRSTNLTPPQTENISPIFTHSKNDYIDAVTRALNHEIKAPLYDYLIFLNSFARGPFLPPYFHGSWTHIFTDQLKNDTHLCLSDSRDLHELNQANLSNQSPEAHGSSSPERRSPVVAMTQEYYQSLQRTGDEYQASPQIQQGEKGHEANSCSQGLKARDWKARSIQSPSGLININSNDQSEQGALENTSRVAHQDKRIQSDRILHPYEAVFINTSLDHYDREDLEHYSRAALATRPSALSWKWQEIKALEKRLNQASLQPIDHIKTRNFTSKTQLHHVLEHQAGIGNQRTCLLALGMHRSGTSALAGCLTLLGFQPPKQLIKPWTTNEKGFFESRVVHNLNEEILAFMDSSWSNCRPLDWSIMESGEGETFITKAIAALNEEYKGTDPIVLKDPRIVRLLPFWRQVLAMADFQITAILIHRHPLEVAESLRARNSMTVSFGKLLWLTYILDAEYNSRELTRTFLSYDQLIQQRQTAFEKISENLGIVWPWQSNPGAQQPSSQINAFLSPELQHHRAKNNDPVNERLEILEQWTTDAYAILQRLAEGSRDPQDQLRLDSIRLELQKAAAILGSMLQVRL